MAEYVAIVLAAGSASRFRAAAGHDGPATKLVATYRGAPLVRRVAQAALASQADSVVVVTGYARAAVEDALADLPLSFVRNESFADGLATSLQCGLRATPPGAAGAVILLGDMPLVGADLVDRLIAAARRHPQALAVVPARAGVRGNPVLIDRALFPAVADLRGDTGARRLLRAAGDAVVEIAVEDEAVTFDIDTPDLLRN